jgi:hypothetical protein
MNCSKRKLKGTDRHSGELNSNHKTPTSLKLIFRFLYFLLISNITATCNWQVPLIASLRSFIIF